jgi:hypothetical protein
MTVSSEKSTDLEIKIVQELNDSLEALENDLAAFKSALDMFDAELNKLDNLVQKQLESIRNLKSK